jgi:two-component system CheB/CheR fusion protein
MSDPRESETSLRERERQLRAVYECAPVGVCETDRDGRLLRVNPKFCELTGRPAADLVGRPIFDLTHPDDAGADRGLYAQLLADEVPSYTLEVRLVRADGFPVWVHVSASACRDADGRPLYGIRVVQDASTRKLAEEALRDSQRRLREENRRKDEFLAMLAHELRNPLAPIRNALELLRMMDAAPGSHLSRVRGIMERQVRQMVRLLDDLLDVSRITRGKLQLRRERVELGAVVQLALETSRPAVEAAGHELTVEQLPDPVWLDADPARLAQVLSNLLNNAAKYTEPGGRIWLTAARPAADDVLVRVRDTGIGIAPDMLPKVFELFAQADRSRDMSQGGLGVGLHLARRLVELHGGSVEAHSDGPGTGSEFVVRLPVLKTADRRSPGADGGGAIGHRPPTTGSRKRVLVADDNTDAADSLAQLLRERGHEVAVAYDGLAALHRAEAFRPDVAVLDLGMPGLTGHEVARRLRQRTDLGRVRLVALTGWGQEEDRRTSLAAGFDLHLVKPLDPADLPLVLEGAGATAPAT